MITVLPLPVTLIPLDLVEPEIVFLPWRVTVEGLVLPLVLVMVMLVDLLVVSFFGCMVVIAKIEEKRRKVFLDFGDIL